MSTDDVLMLIFVAIAQDYLDIVQILLHQWPELLNKHHSIRKINPPGMAIRHNKLAIVEYLIEQPDIDFEDPANKFDIHFTVPAYAD